MPDDNLLEKRQMKIEDAIAKLTEISSDLNKMIAVHELRITQQEKMTDSLEIILEKRRDEFEARIKEVYETIEKEDKNILSEIHNSYEKLSKKITDMERMMWLYLGGMAVAAFAIANWGDLLKLFLSRN